MEYQTLGYLPQAVVNYLVRLGWSYGDQEEFTREELIERFSLEAAGKSAAAINPGKLDWLNAQYIKKIDLEELVQRVRPFIETKGYSNIDSDLLRKAVLSLRERVKTLVEMAVVSEFYFCEEITYDEKAAGKFLTRETIPDVQSGHCFSIKRVGFGTRECSSAGTTISRCPRRAFGEDCPTHSGGLDRENR